MQPQEPSLAVEIAGIRLQNPVMVASGTFGYGVEYVDLVDLRRLGAIVVKGISLEPWQGNRPPRVVEVTSGLLNAIGLQNPGVQGFARDYLPRLAQFGVPIIVNIWGRTIEEYCEVAARLSDLPQVSGLELNISCPNIKEGGLAFGTDAEATRRVISAVRARTQLPLIVKLPPHLWHTPLFARLAEEAGANALSLINTVPAMAIETESRRPALANVTGGLSGPAIHPIAVRLVWEAARTVQIPIIGIGGIAEPRDALEFLIAGASAVAIGTANFTDPDTALRVVDGIAAYLQRHNYASVKQLIGSLEVGREQ